MLQHTLRLGAVLVGKALFPRIARAGDTEHNAHLAKQEQQTCAAGREERQADAGVGQQRRANADVQKYLPPHLRDDADAQQGAVQIRGAQRNADPLHQKRRKESDQRQRTDKAQFLPDHGKDKVVFGIRQPLVLLDTVADADTEQPAGADRIDALQSLPLHACCVCGGQAPDAAQTAGCIAFAAGEVL